MAYRLWPQLFPYGRFVAFPCAVAFGGVGISCRLYKTQKGNLLHSSHCAEPQPTAVAVAALDSLFTKSLLDPRCPGDSDLSD